MAVSSLRASALRLARGTALSQLLVVIATPLLTRCYTPRDFGQLAVFTSLYGVLIGFSTLKLELSVLLPEAVPKAQLLTLLTAAVSGIFCAVVLVGMVLEKLILGLPAGEFFLLPFAIFSGAVLSVGQQWCAREKAFSDIGTSLLTNSGFNVTLSTAFFYAGMVRGGLILGFTLGLAAAATYVVIRRGTIIVGMKSTVGKFSLPVAMALFKEYKNMPMHVLPNSILVSLVYTTLPLIMSRFFDTGTIGLYSVANRFLVLPSILIGGAISDVFRAEFVSRLQKKADYQSLFDRVLELLVVCVVPVFGLMWCLSPLAFEIVFGAKFAGAGEFARYLCIGVVGNLFVQIFSYVFIALARTRTSLMLQFVISVCPLAGFLIGAVRHDIRLALITMSVVNFCACCLFVYVARRSMHFHIALAEADPPPSLPI